MGDALMPDRTEMSLPSPDGPQMFPDKEFDIEVNLGVALQSKSVILRWTEGPAELTKRMCSDPDWFVREARKSGANADLPPQAAMRSIHMRSKQGGPA